MSNVSSKILVLFSYFFIGAIIISATGLKFTKETFAGLLFGAIVLAIFYLGYRSRKAETKK